MSAAPDNNLTEALRWLRQAEEHLSSARWSAQGQHWAFACFQCQQAAELAVKAILIRQGERVRTHGVVELVQRAKAYYNEIDQLLSAARRLDQFYIPTRDPDALPSGTAGQHFDDNDFREAEIAAARVLELVRRVLGPG